MISLFEDKIKIDTPNTTLLIREHADFAELLYYGRRLDDCAGCDIGSAIGRRDAHKSVDNYFTYNTPFSFFGDGNDKETFVLLINSDGTFTSKFTYTGHEVLSALPDGGLPAAHGLEQALALCYEDKVRKVRLKIYIGVYGESDVLTFSSEIFNGGEGEIRVRRLFSAQIDADGVDFCALTLDGAWGSERQAHNTDLRCGSFVVDSKNGSSSARHNPFVAVRDGRTEQWLAFNPVWSGNHKFIAEVSPLGQTRFLSGMNDFMLDYPVASGGRFLSPQTAVAFAPSMSEITARMHRFVSEHIIPARFRASERHVLLNNWEATYMDFDGEKLRRLADLAGELGIELFVLDDGWFANRNDDRVALGDWFDNVKKTGGLKNLSAYVRSRGMKFGLWVEPEMISPDSALFRAHPEFALRLSDCPPVERRYQLMLDLCNPAVCDYIVGALSDIFDCCKPDYVKWDCNRVMSDIYSSYCRDIGKFFYDYEVGLYRILRRLTERYPDTLFESCSSGGNRYDLGMLCFMPQTWCSDDTDARERAEIQSGTLLAYPQSTMGAHVSASPNHQTGNRTPLKERFIVAAAGAFGYELDITKLCREELEEIKGQIAYYKEHRKLLQFGEYRCCENTPALYAYTVSARDKGEVMATVVRKSRPVNRIPMKVRLSGFDSARRYEARFFGSDRTFSASGEVLNGEGLDISDMLDGNDCNALSACLVYFRAVR